jgi:hypothetical protein
VFRDHGEDLSCLSVVSWGSEGGKGGVMMHTLLLLEACIDLVEFVRVLTDPLSLHVFKGGADVVHLAVQSGVFDPDAHIRGVGLVQVLGDDGRGASVEAEDGYCFGRG